LQATHHRLPAGAGAEYVVYGEFRVGGDVRWTLGVADTVAAAESAATIAAAQRGRIRAELTS
jgi:2-isopropylmalate synthase